MDNTLVVVTADHGETLSEFPPFAWSHGSEVGNGAMRVPLILASTGPPLGPPGIVERQAAISGLAPTMEWALGLEPSLGTGHDFWDLVRPGPVRFQEGWPEGPVRPVFMEATRPRSHEPASGWNNLAFFRALRAGGWAIHAAPMYELNPQFTPTDSPPHSAVLQTLTDSLGAWDAQAPTRREVTMTTETRAGLETLGYLEPEE